MNAALHVAGFRADIEGLRALAVILVVLFHAQMPGVSGGFVGVDVFFVISGYLITRLLVAEYVSSDSISLRSFYARRARRLAPAALLVGVTTLAVSAFVYSPMEQSRYAKSGLSAFVYVSNVRFARFSQDYFAPETESDPFLHTWSLAVEEQFYLVWPLIILLGLRRRSVTGLVRLLALTGACSLLGSLVLTLVKPQWAFFLMPLRAWEFAAGGLAAVLPVTDWEARHRAVLGVAGAAIVGASALAFSDTTPFPGGAAIVPVVGSVWLLRSGGVTGVNGPIQRLLGTWPLQWCGRMSYGVYLWHWPLLVMPAAVVSLSLSRRLALAAAAIVLADFTHRTIETPIRTSRRLAMRPVMTMVGVAITTLGAVAIAAWAVARSDAATRNPEVARLVAAAAARPDMDDEKCVATFGETRPLECVFGDEESSTTVLLLGDSHASQWFPALRQIAGRQHWRLVTLVKSACPAADIKVRDERLRREFMECTIWRQASLERTFELKPRLVVISNFNHLYARTVIAGDSMDRAEAVRAGLRRTLSRLNSAGLSTVLLRDSPQLGFDVPSCVGRAYYHGANVAKCSEQLSVAVDQLAALAEQRAAAGLSKVSVLDLTNKICPDDPCRAVEDGVVKFRDGHHLSVPFVLTLAEPLRLGLMSRLAGN